MKPIVAFPDPERALVDLISGLVADDITAPTVGVGVPDRWTPDSPPHIEVAWDGTPETSHPVAEHPTIRVVVRSATTTAAKLLAIRVRGLLLAHPGSSTVGSIRPAVGVMPARDPDTNDELAWFTVRITIRTQLQ